MYQEKTSGSPWPALILGAFVGLVIASGLFYFIFSKDDSKDRAANEVSGLLLSINSPEDEQFSGDQKIKVTGESGEDAIIAVVGGKSDAIVETQNASFAAEVSLSEGQNDLTVFAFDPKTGASAQSSLTILYLNEDLASGNVLLAQSNNKTVEDLKKKIATKSGGLKGNTLNKGSVFGIIRSISENTITVETRQGSLKTVFADDLTRFFNIASGGRSSIQLTDLKVGDRIGAVGISKNSTSGVAKYILRLKKQTPKRHAIAGKVKSLSADSFVITHLVKDDREVTIKINSNTSYKDKSKQITFADIQVSDFVVVTGTPDSKGSLTATKVFLIPGERKGTTKTSSPSATN